MAQALIEPLETRTLFGSGTILFVRGATRSGGFLEGTTAESRNEQLADINNASTANGNAGWAALAQALRDDGFTVEQVVEPKGSDTGEVIAGRPIRFEAMDLSRYAAIVFGSNNARYPRESVDAVETYIRSGGGAVFISDANFGSNWRDAADSDQQFLARFGLIVNQDAASGTTLLSATDFAAPVHPVLAGVGAFEGEGISPITVPVTAPAGVSITRVVGTRGQVRNNDGVDPGNLYQGSLRPATSRDAALVTAIAGAGHVAAYFDRNTFFNANGAGSDIEQWSNRRLALNLFNWVSDMTSPAVVSTTFIQGAPSEVRVRFDDHLAGSLTRSDVLLRDPFDATPVPKQRWSFELVETGAQSELIIRVKGAQPPGVYQLQINAGKFTDDGGNVNAKRIRFNFTIT